MEIRAKDLLIFSKDLNCLLKKKRYWYNDHQLQKIKIKLMKILLKNPEKVYNNYEHLLYYIDKIN